MLTKDLSLDEFIAAFCDAQRVQGYCTGCPNYGNNWACPPFSCDQAAMLRKRYSRISVFIEKTPPHEQALFERRTKIGGILRQMERDRHGFALSSIGGCRVCPQGCARASAQACRFPHKPRPSLEACGFDVSMICRELFGINLQWGGQATFYTIVTALLHNGASSKSTEE